ncbi:MAG: tetratricopeptide repeat protein [Verrucomicrobia bacterium]|nr:tetratricopeptide repeat protein [Verrucomicrobiota bacterium]
MISLHMVRRAGLVLMALAVCLSSLSAMAADARSLFQSGKGRLEEGNSDVAFLYFRELLRDYPDSRYAVEAHFLIARYYKDTRNFFQANQELRAHIKAYPDSPYMTQVLGMLAELEVVDLQNRALKSMESSEYRVAKVLWEDVLAKNPDSEIATRKLAECDRIIERMDYQKRQLENERERIEAESRAIAKLLDDAKRQRAEAERIRAEAEEMDSRTREKYEAALAEANRLSAELEERIQQLEADLKLWRDRARKYEARLLQAPDIGPLQGIAAGGNASKIIFEGVQSDPYPEAGEEQVAGLVSDASPSIVLVNEFLNRETNMLKAEVVVGVDLERAWPRDEPHLLKVRIDFTPSTAAAASTVTSKTIYCALEDMDDVDTRNRAYRKKLIVAVDKNTIDTYAVAAYFVKKTKP